MKLLNFNIKGDRRESDVFEMNNTVIFHRKFYFNTEICLSLHAI